MVLELHNFEGTNTKANADNATMSFNLEASLDLGLSHSGVCSLELGLRNGRVDVDLHLGHIHPQKEVKNMKLSVDLELSLSIGAAVESDVTSVSLASSSLHARPDLQVDEGSTSSKWRGPVALQCMENPVVLDAPGRRRKTSMKTCQFPGCTKGARGASGHCISHGGGRRCKRLGCQKGAEGKTAFCKAHGGGRRCEFLGCTKSAEGRTSYCIAHGGGRRCRHPEGCIRAARGKSDFCIRHGGGKRCKAENCSKSAEGLSGLCIAHGGGRRCQFPECEKGAQGSTKYCKAHGGGKRCTFLGCNKGAEGSTLFCKAHGGGKRCSFDGGCTKSVHGGTFFCVAHGGGKRCGVVGCTRSARGKTDFCVRHGGGKRCKFEGCDKSAQGSTDFCKAHGGGRRCLWGQPGSQFGADGGPACDKFARGKMGLCAAHGAKLQQDKGKEIVAETQHDVAFSGSSGWNGLGFGGGDAYSPAGNGMLSVPEGRVHGGGLMAMLRENRVSFGPSVRGQAGGSLMPRSWV